MNTPLPSGAPQAPETYQLLGRIAGPAVFAIMMLASGSQESMSPAAWSVAAVALWMAIWWATEAVPVAVTAFLPLVLFEPLDISTLAEAARPFSNPIIFLFLGGFVLALALERWNLHRRMALFVLVRTGTDGCRLILSFMVVAALLSMWMTNTATAMLLLPIALSVSGVICDNVEGLDEAERARFRIALLLGLAYATSIGGLATLVGTPPNALLIGFLKEQYGLEISFARWMLVGIPVSLLLLPLAWWVLCHRIFPVKIPASPKVLDHLAELRARLGPMRPAERRVAWIFGLVVAAWILRIPVSAWLGLEGVTDAGIAMTAAVLLFTLPSSSASQPQLLSWQDASRLPWGVLILFGGGLSLAGAVSSSGLALWLGESLSDLQSMDPILLLLATVALVIFLTELTSNLATAATLLPVVGAIALQAGLPPLLLLVPVTLAASCAFMLPVATPPNAIVFATGAITIPQMIRAGFWLNLLGIGVICLIGWFLAPHVFA
ncbi:MAG: SLC13 family permease [Steroidobacteraceae bacterium]